MAPVKVRDYDEKTATAVVTNVDGESGDPAAAYDDARNTWQLEKQKSQKENERLLD